MTTPSPQLKTQAIRQAIEGNWTRAIEINLQILKTDPEDIETLNRLAFAQAIMGKTTSAKKTYQKALDIDGQNPIALKNLKKLKSSPSNSFGKSHVMPQHSEDMFLEESGKTKVIDLIHTAESRITSRLTTGEMLSLRVKRLKIFVLDGKSSFIGMLPDDIGKRLIKFIKGGNMYEAYVKTLDKNRIAVFIKETKRSNRFKNLPSFSLGEKTKASFPSRAYKSDVEEGEEEEAAEE